ncbi:unnamed protein product [Cyprideis torosa]|uniref:Large ribosomal subunit protein uL4m n=1 Tax=Cyprideis torosa TaxID=163714 RepID=A0A7R8ZL51_9CRUS|nr:unnamed protein product [Cyprideis torosa]CAG0890993.1 unnamed protein product [Cyprideis torosa]
MTLDVSRSWERLPITRPPREAWIESWVDDYCPLGILPLNSYVFAHPVDIWCIQKNVHWQHNLRRINWTFAKNRKEMRGGGRKPWPQKGTGRARAGSIRAPHFINGGAGENAPRGPNSFYVPIEEKDKIAGLCSVLSAKFAQDDIRIVPDLHVPSDSPKFMHDLMERRKWGVSALLVDDTDEFPENITKICNEIDQVNIMPVYGAHDLME